MYSSATDVSQPAFSYHFGAANNAVWHYSTHMSLAAAVNTMMSRFVANKNVPLIKRPIGSYYSLYRLAATDTIGLRVENRSRDHVCGWAECFYLMVLCVLCIVYGEMRWLHISRFTC